VGSEMCIRDRSEPVEFKFTRGLVLTVAPCELLEKATSTQSKERDEKETSS